MKHACLGWGSLIWNPGGLPVQGSWEKDGPMLPIEFARQSQNGRITLVLVPGKIDYSSSWALIDVKSLSEAKEALQEREEIPKKNIEKHIGVWSSDKKVEGDIESTIARWAESKSLTSVVWTALPPKFNGENDVVPTKEEVVNHLSNLDRDVQEKAKEYVLKAPEHLITEYRLYIESQLGWVRK